LRGFKFIRTGKRFDTKSSGMILNSYAGPKGGGQEPGVNRQDSRFGHRVSDTRSAKGKPAFIGFPFYVSVCSLFTCTNDETRLLLPTVLLSI